MSQLDPSPEAGVAQTAPAPMPFHVLRDPPHWVPPGVDFETLSKPVQNALCRVVGPAYEELVEQATDALERALGLSVVHMIWTEILRDFQLGLESGHDPSARATPEKDAWVARQLQLFETKARTCRALLKHREQQQRFGRRRRRGDAGTR